MVSTIGVGVALAPARPRAFEWPRLWVIRTTLYPVVPAVPKQGYWAPGAGSSSSNRASEYAGVEVLLAASRRLVREVFKNTWMFTAGIVAPGAVGTPPMQFKTKSPTSSVSPSDRAG